MWPRRQISPRHLKSGSAHATARNLTWKSRYKGENASACSFLKLTRFRSFRLLVQKCKRGLQRNRFPVEGSWMDEKHDGVGFNVASPVSKRIDPSILRPFGGLRPLQRKTLMSFPQCHVRRPVYLLSMYSPNVILIQVSRCNAEAYRITSFHWQDHNHIRYVPQKCFLFNFVLSLSTTRARFPFTRLEVRTTPRVGVISEKIRISDLEAIPSYLKRRLRRLWLNWYGATKVRTIYVTHESSQF